MTMWKYMQITWIKDKRESVLNRMKSYINVGLSDTGTCVIDLVMMPDWLILWSRAQTSCTLVKRAGCGLASSFWITGKSQSGKNQASNNLSVSGVPSLWDWDKLYPEPPTFSHLYLSLTVYQALQMELPVQLLIIIIIFISSPIMSLNLLALRLLSLLERDDSLLRWWWRHFFVSSQEQCGYYLSFKK